MFNTFNKLINEYDNINIYCHINPDLDALGSSFGLKKLIELNFKNKLVKVICQKHDYSIMPDSDILDENILDSTLGILLDVSNSNRVYDQSFLKCNKTIRIDHHPDEIEFTTYKIADKIYASTCELLVKIIQENNYNLDSHIASCLYLGMLSDTLAFKTNNTTKNSLLSAAYLLDYDIDLVELNRYVFTSNITKYNLETYIRNKIIIKNKFAYSILSQKDLKDNNTDVSYAKSCVYLYGQLKDIEIYAIFVECEDGSYEASLRSFKLQVSDVANLYKGGGHYCASGVKSLTINNINDIIETLSNRSIKE